MDRMSKQIPELNYLLSEVEKRYGRRLSTSTDFAALSVVIEHDVNDLISASTLKRLWGYVSSNPIPRISTLDILSRFISFRDFSSFRESLKNSDFFESTFFTGKRLFSSDLQEGQKVIVGWNPDRLIELIYKGNNIFEVSSNCNSSLAVGDVFELPVFLLGYPMYIPRILRNGEYTPSYIAGANDGLTLLEVLPG